ncbi:hypothetical protein Vadar_022889 [Vaccinium darrowii]|uniref:Uncharacterized protein n=1 Tax=Vaccinium darrowii TaxID=229202 RepID=A0ACB7XTT9_9ERIC|nr:hypothetical protein Vadar_022889 [Vaccinium darrowii]
MDPRCTCNLENSVVAVSSAEMAKEVMKTHDITFVSRPYLPATDPIGKKRRRPRSTSYDAIVLLKEVAVAAAGFAVSDLFPLVKILPMITSQKSNLEKIHREVDRILDGIIDEHKATKEAIKTVRVKEMKIF